MIKLAFLRHWAHLGTMGAPSGKTEQRDKEDEAAPKTAVTKQNQEFLYTQEGRNSLSIRE